MSNERNGTEKETAMTESTKQAVMEFASRRSCFKAKDLAKSLKISNQAAASVLRKLIAEKELYATGGHKISTKTGSQGYAVAASYGIRKGW